MPQMVAAIALTSGDTLIFDSHTVGGYTIANHTVDTASLNKIMQGGWDRVVIQGQSSELVTATPEISPFPYARKLDSLVHHYNPCGETMFYMTWGYKNGDGDTSCANNPLFCTYEAMDSTIRGNYLKMAMINRAEVAPAGPVRHYIRHHYLGIELYQADESHPTAAGSFAVACAFYTTIFRKDPALTSYNATLSAADADSIRAAASIVAFDSLSTWSIGEYDGYIDSLCSPTGIRVPGHDALITLYPNPATNMLRIHAAGNSQLHGQLYNYMGALLRELQIAGNTSIDISALPAGNYFVRLDGYAKVYRFTKL